MVEKVNLLFKLSESGYNLNQFYNVQINTTCIALQGRCTETIMRHYESLGHKFLYDADHYWFESYLEVEGIRINITLTLLA